VKARALIAALSLLAAPPALAAKKVLSPGEKIDLNRASVAELMRLPGIGRTRAEAIAARRARSPFQRVDDVRSVRGISASWLEKQRPHLAVSATSGVPSAPAQPASPATPKAHHQ
jgi:competence protein ComEA